MTRSEDPAEDLAEFLPAGRDPRVSVAAPPVRLFEYELTAARPGDVAAPAPLLAQGRREQPDEPIAGEPIGDVGLDDAAREEDAGEPADVGDSRRTWWRSRPRARTQAFIAGLLVGALVSGLGVYGWQRSRAGAAERDRVVLTARVSSVEVAGPGEWPVTVLVDNFGRSPVRIDGARLAGGRLFNSALRPVSQGVTVRPGQQVPLRLDVSLDCTGGRDGGHPLAPNAVAVTLAPSGRPLRTIRVRLAVDEDALVDLARDGCLTGAATLDVGASLSRRTSPSLSGRTLNTPISIEFSTYPAHSGDRRRAWSGRILTLRSAVPGLALTVTPTPLRVPYNSSARSSRSAPGGPFSLEATLRWRVTNCRLVGRLEADIWVMVDVSRATSTVMVGTALRLGTDVLLAVSRFVGGVCGAGGSGGSTSHESGPDGSQ
jgi:hypothetical protein